MNDGPNKIGYLFTTYIIELTRLDIGSTKTFRTSIWHHKLILPCHYENISKSSRCIKKNDEDDALSNKDDYHDYSHTTK